MKFNRASHPELPSYARWPWVLDECRELGLKAIPVVKISDLDDANEAVKAAVARDGNGYLLRIDANDMSAKAVITKVNELVRLFGLQRRRVHFLLDYSQNAMKLQEDIPKIPAVYEWLTLSSSSSAFPKTISTLPEKTWIDVPRHDWNSWVQSVTKNELPRIPTFSDYSTRTCGPPADFGDPIVHLRYTKGGKMACILRRKAEGRRRQKNAIDLPRAARIARI